MNVYKLMHNNDIAAVIKMDAGYRIVEKMKVMEPSLLPLQGWTGERGLTRWWEQRQVPMNQEGFRELLAHVNLEHASDFLVRNLGLSLNDCYWIQPIEENMRWEDVSLFSNPFRSFSVSDDRQENADLFTPASSTGGELLKRWMIIDGKRVLLKGNKRGESMQQSLNEVFAAKLHELQEFDNYVRYKTVPMSLVDPNLGGTGCISENFASEQLEYIPAIQVVESKKKRNDISWFEHYISICTENGIAENEIRSFMDYMLLTDFILTNTDRHFMNFGVLRDSKTLRFVKPAPIFDSGNCMFYQYRKLPDLGNIRINSFAQTEKKQLKYIRSRNRIEVDKLPDAALIREIYMRDPDADAYVDMIIDGYQRKKDQLTNSNQEREDNI